MWEAMAEQIAQELIGVPGVAEAKVGVFPVSADVALLLVHFTDVIDGATHFAYVVRKGRIGNGGGRC